MIRNRIITFALSAALLVSAGIVSGADNRSDNSLSSRSLRDGSNFQFHRFDPYTRLSLKDVRVIPTQNDAPPVVMIEYRCDRMARVSALVQKIELGTGVIQDQRLILDQPADNPAADSRRRLGYLMGHDEGFRKSGMYSILLQSVREGSDENFFITFYWDAERRNVQVVTDGSISPEELARERMIEDATDWSALNAHFQRSAGN